LQNRQRETDGVPAASFPFGDQAFGAIHFLADVIGDFTVQMRFAIRETIVHRVGAPFWKKRRVIELDELLFGHTPHQVGRINLVHTIAKASLKTIRIEERHKELEIFFLAIVWRRGEEQEMTRDLAEELTQFVALRRFDFAAEEGRRHLVRFITHDHVPIGRVQFGLNVLVAAQLIEAADDEILFGKGIARARFFNRLARDGGKVELKAPPQFVLPLFGERTRTTDETPPEVAAHDEFFEEQARHNRLARAGVVCEQETQRLTHQHFAVHRGDLMRQWFDEGSMNREERIEKMREANAVRFGDKAKERAIAVETPRATCGDNLQHRLAVTVEQFVAQVPGIVLLGQFDRVRAKPLDIHHCDGTGWQNAFGRCAALEIFEPCHVERSSINVYRDSKRPPWHMTRAGDHAHSQSPQVVIVPLDFLGLIIRSPQTFRKNPRFKNDNLLTRFRDTSISTNVLEHPSNIDKVWYNMFVEHLV